MKAFLECRTCVPEGSKLPRYGFPLCRRTVKSRLFPRIVESVFQQASRRRFNSGKLGLHVSDFRHRLQLRRDTSGTPLAFPRMLACSRPNPCLIRAKNDGAFRGAGEPSRRTHAANRRGCVRGWPIPNARNRHGVHEDPSPGIRGGAA